MSLGENYSNKIILGAFAMTDKLFYFNKQEHQLMIYNTECGQHH